MKKRYNIFTQIHKGLHAMLYDAGMALQHNDFTSAEETKVVFEKLNEVLEISEAHSYHEDYFVLPAVSKFNPEIVELLKEEHMAGKAMCHRLKSLMANYRGAISDDAMKEAGEVIYKAFNEFIAFNLYHMNKEEDRLNKVLWANYTDGEIIGLQKAIAGSTAPKLMAIEGAWMMRGSNDTEIIQWLVTVKNGATDVIFQSLIGIAESELAPDRWNKILEALCEGAMVA